jgi:hypothetical protein
MKKLFKEAFGMPKTIEGMGARLLNLNVYAFFFAIQAIEAISDGIDGEGAVAISYFITGALALVTSITLYVRANKYLRLVFAALRYCDTDVLEKEDKNAIDLYNEMKEQDRKAKEVKREKKRENKESKKAIREALKEAKKSGGNANE